MDLDDELRLALQRLVGEAVHGLGVQYVVGLLLPVQPLGGVDVPGLLVYLEDGPGSVAGEDVPHAAVAAVGVRVELRTKAQRERGGSNICLIFFALRVLFPVTYQPNPPVSISISAPERGLVDVSPSRRLSLF